MAVSAYLLIISGQNASIKRHRVTDCIIKKQDSSVCCLQETQYRIKDTCSLKVRGWKKSFYIWKLKKARVALISEKKYIYFKTNYKNEKGGHHIKIKGSIK